ncbi:hypothetical protein [Thalassobacillus sp. CUG 92003]|uniref:hypothetical protein n=1 Tax=Thalassobacillus sp. CUG 92003 TaxID=2736641 RepID=UPI0015E6F7DF|nr:hypothetical protein [Thalassobacillus sp. CUG 92003]
MRRHKQDIGSLLIIATLLVLTACQTSQAIPNGYYTYNEDKVESAVKQVAYDPELPAYLPIEMMAVVSDHFSTDRAQTLDLSFYTANNDLLSIQYAKGDTSESLHDAETIALKDNLQVNYQDNAFAKTVVWNKGDITYKMIYRQNPNSDEDKQSVTKEQLLQVVRSFQL